MNEDDGAYDAEPQPVVAAAADQPTDDAAPILQYRTSVIDEDQTMQNSFTDPLTA